MFQKFICIFSIQIMMVAPFIEDPSSYKNNVCPTIEDYLTIEHNPNCSYDIAADTNKTVVDIILHYGYSAERHKVITQDKYILTLFRMYTSNGTNNYGIYQKQPVLMQHGWLNTALSYFGRGRDSLPFLLADAGYDVWLGNFRGTQYSEGHLNLTVYDSQYWDHSIDDLATYDLPALLNHVLEVTNYNQKIIYIGHSMGSTTGLMFSSTFPVEAKTKLKLMLLLAPAAGFKNVKSIGYKLAYPIVPAIVNIIERLRLMRLISQAKVLSAIMRTICFETPRLLNSCMKFWNIVLAGPLSQIDFKTIPLFVNHYAAGGSLKLFLHFTNMHNYFVKPDYGRDNIRVYGTDSPPIYPVAKIKVPTFVFHAVNDYLVTPEDTKILYNQLSHEARYGVYKISEKYFNHFDFLYGKNVKSLVYNAVLSVLNGL